MPSGLPSKRVLSISVVSAVNSPHLHLVFISYSIDLNVNRAIAFSLDEITNEEPECIAV